MLYQLIIDVFHMKSNCCMYGDYITVVETTYFRWTKIFSKQKKYCIKVNTEINNNSANNI